ncbi:MAG: AlpA family phage regulatory protein [Halioglobus sp.]|nr:AlpA family phage regulatory protein [Halioglobus sp.]
MERPPAKTSYADASKILIRLPEVMEIIPYSRSTLYALISIGVFPAPVKLQWGRASAWILAEVLEHAESLIAQRNRSVQEGV